MKSILKFTLLFVIVAILSVATATLAFIITQKVIHKPEEPQEPQEVMFADSSYAATSESVDIAPKTPSYTVRLEGNNLNIYTACDSGEEFLYNAEICKSDLSAEDLHLLTSGVTLKGDAALTEFMENYTS